MALPFKRLFVVCSVLAILAAGCASATQDVEAAAEPAAAEPAASEPAEPAAPVDEPELVVEDDEASSDASPSTELEEAEEVEEVEDAPVAPGANEVIRAADSELSTGVYNFGGNPDITLATALDITLPTVGGEPVEVSSYLGEDVVLWFWAPWCSWCNSEASRVRTVADEFNGEVEVVGIAGVSDEESMQAFVDRHELQDITHLADLTGEFWLSLDVTYQPWWMFVNNDGTVVHNWQGRLSEDEMRHFMGELAAL